MRKNHRKLRTTKRKSQAKRKQTIAYNWSEKHLEYMRKCEQCTYNIAEGAVRAGKTVDNVYAFAHILKTHPNKLHLATGATSANAKLNIAECDGRGLKYIFRGQCREGKFEGNECLVINGPDTNYKDKIVIFAGGAKSNSFQKIRGNSYGMWIATEINQHHKSMIQECFNRIAASLLRKIFWDLNPDHPKHPIYSEHIDRYVNLGSQGKMPGGVNYERFTLFDNINLPKENIEQIVAQYEKGSIWYTRDIDGERCIAEGLIYRKLASEFSLAPGNIKEHSLTVEEARQLRFEKIVVAIDFGGTGSGHAIVAVGITDEPRYQQKVVCLRSRRYLEGDNDVDTGNKIEDIDPQALGRIFVAFVENIIDTYGYVSKCYADSAEPVLIRGLKSAMTQNSLAHIAPKPALKTTINDRIFCLSSLSAQGRFFYVENECRSMMDAVSQAIWDPKKLTGNERLDNGTSDIDTMDALEYCFEHDILKLIKSKGGEHG